MIPPPCAARQSHGAGSLPAGDDSSGVTHTPAGRCGLAGDKGDDRFGYVRLGESCGFLFRRAPDLTDHDDAICLTVILKQSESIDMRRANNRIAADSNGARLTQTQM